MPTKQFLFLFFHRIVLVFASDIQLLQRHGNVHYLNTTNLDPSIVLRHVKSRSFLSCCTFCHESQNCGGVAYSEGECWLIKGTPAACGDFLKEKCSTCQHKVMMYSTKSQNIGTGKYNVVIYSTNSKCIGTSRSKCTLL